MAVHGGGLVPTHHRHWKLGAAAYPRPSERPWQNMPLRLQENLGLSARERTTRCGGW
jgi:hypothetical protein